MKQVILIALISIFFVVINFSNVMAEDFTPVGFKNIASEKTGHYKTTLQISPPEPIAGPVKFALVITDSTDGSGILDAKVQIYAEPEKGPKQYTPGLNSQKFGNVYIGMLELETGGIWTVEAIIESKLGNGNVIVPLHVKERTRSANSITGNILFVGVTLVFIFIPVKLWLESRRVR